MNKYSAAVPAVYCPICAAEPGATCTYLPPAYPDATVPVARAGRPTTRPHTERLTLATAPARRAEEEFARREAQQLRAWLAEHASILIRAMEGAA